MEDLQKKVQAIIDRNTRVEAEKAWERSLSRRICILLGTYVISSFFLWLLNIPYFYIHAVVPTGAYLLSTLSLPWIQKVWMRNYLSKNRKV